MNTFIALLRAVNVGGTGKLPMQDLRDMCVRLGFENVQTYIQSGNVVFKSSLEKADVRELIEKKLHEYFQKQMGVIILNLEELRAAFAENPYKNCMPNRVLITFLNESIANLDGIKNQKNEEITLVKNLIYVHYGEGMAQSRLLIPAAKTGTARNINTIAKLIEMASKNE